MRLNSAFSTLVQSRNGNSDKWLHRRDGIIRFCGTLTCCQFISGGRPLTFTLATNKVDLVMDLYGVIAIVAHTAKRPLFHHLGQRLRRILATNTDLVRVEADGQQFTRFQLDSAFTFRWLKRPEMREGLLFGCQRSEHQFLWLLVDKRTHCPHLWRQSHWIVGMEPEGEELFSRCDFLEFVMRHIRHVRLLIVDEERHQFAHGDMAGNGVDDDGLLLVVIADVVQTALSNAPSQRQFALFFFALLFAPLCIFLCILFLFPVKPLLVRLRFSDELITRLSNLLANMLYLLTDRLVAFADANGML